MRLRVRLTRDREDREIQRSILYTLFEQSPFIFEFQFQTCDSKSWCCPVTTASWGAGDSCAAGTAALDFAGHEAQTGPTLTIREMYVEDDLHTDRPQADRPIVPKPIVLKLTIREMYVEDEQLGDGWHIVGIERDGARVPILQACGLCCKEGSTSRIDVKAWALRDKRLRESDKCSSAAGACASPCDPGPKKRPKRGAFC